MVDRLIPLLEVSDGDEVGPGTRNDPRKVGQCPEHWNWETSIRRHLIVDDADPFERELRNS